MSTMWLCMQWLDGLPAGKREKRLKETMGELCCPLQLNLLQPMCHHLQCPVQKSKSFAFKASSLDKPWLQRVLARCRSDGGESAGPSSSQ